MAAPIQPPDALAAAKAALRRELRSARRAHVAALGAAGRARAEAALASVLLPQLRRAQVVAVYAATGAEIRPDALAAALPAAVQIAWPRVSGDHLRFHACAAGELVAGYHGIPEPPATAPEVAPEVVLVPLVGVSRDGWRLGQGGGFYDRTLAALRAASPLRAIGLGWELQLQASIPHTGHDQRLDAIATPSGFCPVVFYPAPGPATDKG